MNLSADNVATLMASLPQTVSLAIALFVILCKVITVFVQPPAATSKWAKVYTVVNTIALNFGWAANRLQVGRTGVMVRRDDAAAAKAVIAEAGIPLAAPTKALPPPAE